MLEGVFSDEHGDWPAGTYLLNPEGFRHAPFSESGCLLFVKLRQYAGAGRHHVALCTHDAEWTPGGRPGVEQKILYAHPKFPDVTHLERWAPGTAMEINERKEPRSSRSKAPWRTIPEPTTRCRGCEFP